MNVMKRVLIVLAVAVGGAAAVATPAHANDGRFSGFAPQTSVFPVPRDPWRSWGLRSELPEHVRAPRFRGDAVVVAPAPGPVWVQGQWVWNGFNWVWWPGHWQ
jgi:hypothetical protein